MPDPIHQWIDMLKQKGLSEEDLNTMLAASAVAESAGVFLLLTASLTEDDIKLLETISDQNEAMKKAEELFQQRTGMTVDELVQKVESGAVEKILHQSQQPANVTLDD
ncbi:MAG TPA: hypothetical protein VFG51_02205 [Candidatus Saccharimonadia bacterium]|nr:hypothetical protein [Candidatus Saccharimonadia bacterium]